MVIIRADLLPEREEIQNEMPTLLERVTPSSRMLMDILEFHSKSRSRFGLQSSAYLLAQRLNILELQINYLKCPFDIQAKISSHVQEKWFNTWYAACIDYYQNFSYDIWEAWSTTIFFPDRSGVGGVRFPANTLPPNDPIMKAWEYGMVAYFLEIPNPESHFFKTLTKFQKCMFRRIHQVFISPDSPTKFPYNRSLDIEVHCAVIEYENGKAKPAHYLVRLTDGDEPEDLRQDWFPKNQGAVTDPTLARAIGFFNIYHIMWESIERGKILMHCGNTTFIYHTDFSKYMEVEGATSEDVYDYLFDLGAGKYLSEKGKKYLHELFEKWDPEHLENDEGINDRFEDIIGDEGMQNLEDD